MNNIVRDFKRHYHKVRVLIPDIANQGAFSLNINWQGEKLSASTSTPNPEISIQFAVLMRRFLAQESKLYYEKILNVIRENAPDVLTDEKLETINAYINSMKNGAISIQINNKHFSANEIYDLISEGEYFQNDKKASNFLKDIALVPVAGPLFWHQFYSYTLDGFFLISIFFDLILEWQKRTRKNQKDKDVHVKKCIYCLNTDNNFQSEEHIFPEGLGNDEAVLPKGYVCDNCNNGALSRLDAYLIGFEPISLLKVPFVPYTKSGKLPKANFQNMVVEKTHPRHIKITAKDKSGEMRNKKELGDGWVSWNMNFRGKQVNPVRLGQSLYKIGLGFVAFDQGLDVALSTRFDLARDYISGKSGFPNDLLINTNIFPHPNLRVIHKDLAPGYPFLVDIFGVVFMFNLEKEPLIELNDVLIKSGFQKFSLQKSKNAR
jgi:hypothetical protein